MMVGAPLARVSGHTTRQPLWDAVDEAAAPPAMLARVLAHMFDTEPRTMRRGDVKWWLPRYLQAPRPEAITARFPQRDAAVRFASIAEYLAAYRGHLAEANRRMRDADVLLFTDLKDRRLFLFDTHTHEWRDGSGGAMGENLIELGMLRWKCPFEDSAARISRITGLVSIPEVRG